MPSRGAVAKRVAKHSRMRVIIEYEITLVKLLEVVHSNTHAGRW